MVDRVKEIDGAIAGIKTVLKAMPIEFMMLDLCPADHLVSAIGALEALRDSDTGRSEAKAMAKLLSEAEPTISRQGNDITLQCPDGTITDEIYDALEAACYGAAPSPTPQGQGERKSDG